MDASYSPKTSQKADVRPISFVLDSEGAIFDPITLPVRPEDLTRNEPARATVHQTMEPGLTGWVDHFGEGLPSVTISGHTGWKYNPALGRDGFESFEVLNDLVVRRYPALRQVAIDAGRDPAGVKLIFVDLLDGFAWEVVPTQFVLRRSRSRPLLFQYNMTLQAVSTQIDGGLARFAPNLGSISAGLGALDAVIGRMDALKSSINGALKFVQAGASTIMGFVNKALSVVKSVRSVVSAATSFITGVAGTVVGIAKGLSMVGREVFRTIAAISSIPSVARAALTRMASAFNELVCIFSNSLRPRNAYQQYEGLYGSSNCSSTTGGRTNSPYAGQNVFSLLAAKDQAPVSMSGTAISSASMVVASDPVLAPLPPQELARHLGNINAGTVVQA